MNASTLQQELRRVLWERIRAGKLTGLGLARQTGFEQAHISNFLHGKRSLSIESMDRILAAQNLSLYDVLDRAEIDRRASAAPSSEGDFENVVLVDANAAMTQQIITRDAIRDILKFKKTFLKRLRPACSSGREKWQRFVLIKIDAQEAASMYPRLLPGATLLIDRHYNLLQPYRRNEPNIYAVARNGSCTVRYVERDGDHLVLRPQNQSFPITVLALEGANAFDAIVGRVCHVAIET